MIRDVAGAVLAGGGSRRMGRDKARLALGGVPLARRAMDVLGAVLADVALVAGSERDYSDLGGVQVRDRHPGAGPLAGLEAALGWAGSRPLFVLACDLPRVGRVVVARVLERAGGRRDPGGAAWARVARRDGRDQPLCALYSPRCAPVAASLLAAGRRSVHELLARVEVEAVTFDDVTPDPFLNVNTPADLQAAGGGPEIRR
ncbi:MAG: molybdenum cofactor guanylyltransferase [Acidobacteriota bacterium]|nr:molybdenum cofactor guanylyltransferase [Acidobacteriota bacterium]